MFNRILYYIFQYKAVKKIMFKEVKEGAMAMSQQIENNKKRTDNDTGN